MTSFRDDFVEMIRHPEDFIGLAVSNVRLQAAAPLIERHLEALADPEAPVAAVSSDPPCPKCGGRLLLGDRAARCGACGARLTVLR